MRFLHWLIEETYSARDLLSTRPIFGYNCKRNIQFYLKVRRWSAVWLRTTRTKDQMLTL